MKAKFTVCDLSFKFFSSLSTRLGESPLASINPFTKQQQFHVVCNLSLALAQYIILSESYPKDELSLKAKFSVCALSFKFFVRCRPDSPKKQ